MTDSDTYKCIYCIRGIAGFCLGDPCDGELISDITETGMVIISDKEKAENKDASLLDPQSTGRKRAAQLFPLDREADCEWAQLEKAGGGKQPIIGCAKRHPFVAGKQRSRHHGPDKNTLNNEPGNVHRICHECHNLWHALNDTSREHDRERRKRGLDD